MLRYYDPTSPDFKQHQEDARRYNAPQWMLDLLLLNPKNLSWSPWDDFVKEKRFVYWSWKDFDFQLNDSREVVNFYFSLERYIDRTAPVLSLALWVICPDDGTTINAVVEDLQQSDIPEVLDFLRQARDRNSERFAKLDSRQPEPGSAVLGGNNPPPVLEIWDDFTLVLLREKEQKQRVTVEDEKFTKFVLNLSYSPFLFSDMVLQCIREVKVVKSKNRVTGLPSAIGELQGAYSQFQRIGRAIL